MRNENIISIVCGDFYFAAVLNDAVSCRPAANQPDPSSADDACFYLFCEGLKASTVYYRFSELSVSAGLKCSLCLPSLQLMI